MFTLTCHGCEGERKDYSYNTIPAGLSAVWCVETLIGFCDFRVVNVTGRITK